MRCQWDEMTDVHPRGVNSPALRRMLFQFFRMRYICVLAIYCANLTFGFALLGSVKASQQTFSKQVAQNLSWIIKVTCWTKSERASVQQLFWFLPVGRLVHQKGLHSSPWNHLEADNLHQGERLLIYLICTASRQCLSEFSLLELMNFSYVDWSCSRGYGVHCNFII